MAPEFPAQISYYVKELFSNHESPALLYHNLEHTLAVVQHAMEIAGHYTLSQPEYTALYAAAYFHDTGHLIGVLEGHEEVSVLIMEDFFRLRGLGTADLIQRIAACIMATKMPSEPMDLPGQIIRDADSYHVGTTEFMALDKKVWDELEARLGKKIDDRPRRSLRFLEKHHFYTAYCQELLDPGKQRNIGILKSLAGN